MANVAPEQTNVEWSPHASKEFARLQHAIARQLPDKMRSVRRLTRLMAGDLFPTTKRGG